ncbi:hypothetical protein WJ438_23450 [Streptomyces sp. GD-15H]|uniref:hypothetical protein n=1 Tax=Streptomyces sp. GD-15H TaxID=3129112 RepID=UPI0032545FC9
MFEQALRVGGVEARGGVVEVESRLGAQRDPDLHGVRRDGPGARPAGTPQCRREQRGTCVEFGVRGRFGGGRQGMNRPPHAVVVHFAEVCAEAAGRIHPQPQRPRPVTRPAGGRARTGVSLLGEHAEGHVLLARVGREHQPPGRVHQMLDPDARRGRGALQAGDPLRRPRQPRVPARVPTAGTGPFDAQPGRLGEPGEPFPPVPHRLV